LLLKYFVPRVAPQRRWTICSYSALRISLAFRDSLKYCKGSGRLP